MTCTPDGVTLSPRRGECVMTPERGADGKFTGYRIARSDPVGYVSAALVDSLRRGEGWFGMPITLDGDVLRVHGINRTAVYVLRERTQDGDWLAQWPD